LSILMSDKPLAPTGKEWDKAVKYWNTLRSDEGAHFDKTLSFKASDIKPQVGANKNFVDFNV
jgi:3-isopropylmalate/(R)-2-methylmalate dehydratase large subunit